MAKMHVRTTEIYIAFGDVKSMLVGLIFMSRARNHEIFKLRKLYKRVGFHFGAYSNGA